MPVHFQVIWYKNFGKCIQLQNEVCSVIVTAEVGPRIIYYGMKDGINLFREDVSRESFQSGVLFDRFYYPGAVWYHYGGHRLWFTPEKSPDTYYPDNDPVSWAIEQNTLVLTPPEQLVNRVQYVIKVELEPQGTGLTVEHRIKNCSDVPRRLAPWTVTQMASQGEAVIPLPQFKDERLYPRQKLLLWDNTSVSDPRFTWRQESLRVRHDPASTDCIKLGLHYTGGKAFYRKGGYLCIIQFPFKEGGSYPDGGASFELYCCGQFCEMETMGEEVDLLPGDQVCHPVRFSLQKEDGESLSAFLGL